MEVGQGEDTAVQADHKYSAQPEVPGAFGDCYGDCVAMAVNGECCE